MSSPSPRPRRTSWCPRPATATWAPSRPCSGHAAGRVPQPVTEGADDRALAEDLSSETYIRAVRAIGRFQGGSQDVLVWILRISRNLFLDHVKSGRVRWDVAVGEMPVTVSAVDPEEEAVSRVEADQLRRALSRLTAEQQEVVFLRFLQGLSIAEVAGIVGRAEGAVKALQVRALRTLARLLRDEAIEE